MTLPISAQEPEGGYRLKYVPDIGLNNNKMITTDAAEVVFKKEPSFQGHDVIRNILAGTKGESTMLCFAYDLTANKLYIDLNRNLDLTDDPTGIREPDDFDVSIPQQGVTIPYRVTMRYFKNTGNPQFYLRVSSGWTGKVTLAGKTYMIGLLDMPDGTLGSSGKFFIDEWTDEMDGQKLRDHPLGNISGIPHHLFLQGVYYELGYKYVPGEAGQTDLMFTAKPIEVPLGALAFEGENLRRVTLHDKLNGPVCVVLDRPGPIVQVPVGKYEAESVILSDNEKNGFLLKGDQELKFAVTADQPASLKLGAPLKQVISATTGWHHIAFYQKYVGVTEEEYRLIGNKPPTAPTFTVSKNGQTVANCKFSYG